MQSTPYVAVPNDWRSCAAASSDWSPLCDRAKLQFFDRSFGTLEEARAGARLLRTEVQRWNCTIRATGVQPQSVSAHP